MCLYWLHVILAYPYGEPKGIKIISSMKSELAVTIVEISGIKLNL